jgi:hypothetical protein
MPKKEISAVKNWEIDYPNDYIVGEKLKFRAASTSADRGELLNLLNEVYGVSTEFEPQQIPTNRVVLATEIDWLVKGLKDRPVEILLGDFSLESWEMIRSAR